MPEEKGGRHAGEHVVVPTRIFPYFIVVHAGLRFSLLKALFDGPTHTAEPYEELQSGAQRSVNDVAEYSRLGRIWDQQRHT
jgi:hypothetical protein